MFPTKNVKCTLGKNQLHRVLIDDDTKRIVSSGSTLTLKEGYVLKMKDIDIGAGQGQILIALLKDGNEVDADIVTGQDTYQATDMVKWKSAVLMRMVSRWKIRIQ